MLTGKPAGGQWRLPTFQHFGLKPVTPYPYLTQTGPFRLFGETAKKGEVIKGPVLCSSGVWPSRPDGSHIELLAWGIRNPYGMAIKRPGLASTRGVSGIERPVACKFDSTGKALYVLDFGVVKVTEAEKDTDQLMLKEYVLEMCSLSILYKHGF